MFFFRFGSKIEKVARGIQGEKSSKDTECSGNLIYYARAGSKYGAFIYGTK